MAEHTHDSKPASPSRRGLVFSLIALPFVVGSKALLGRATTTRSRPGNALDSELSVADAKNRGQALLGTYPQPRWLPPDFKIQSTTACSEDRWQRGVFLGVDDRKQLRFSVIRTNSRSHADFINSGLVVCVAPLAEMPQLRGKAGEGTPLTIAIGDGKTVDARYYDSHANRATFGAAHFLTLQRNGFGVIVSSFHKNRLTRQDLERVAIHVL
jgi:hypothetical protein